MRLQEINIIGLIPTRAGCAVFLGKEEKVIQFFIALPIGHAINSALADEKSERPLTHDLFSQTLKAFGSSMKRMVITDYKEEVYFAKIYWEMENELHAKKFVEIDARPSDAMALAVRYKAPIFISEEIWEASEDMSSLFFDLRNQAEEEGHEF